MKTDDTLTPPRYQSEKLGRREIFRDIARRVPKDKLRLFMTMTQVAAAKAIGISPTTLKKLCRYYGISRWPYRQIAGKTRAVDRLGELLDEPSSELPKAVLKDHLSLLRRRVLGDGGPTMARRASSAPHGLVRYGGADTDHAGTPGGAASFVLNADPPSSPCAAAACSAPLSCHLHQSPARDGMTSSMPAYCCYHGNGVAPIGGMHTTQMTAFRGRGRYDGESIRPAFSSAAIPVAVAQMMPTPATGSSTPTVAVRRSHVLPSTVGEAEPAASAADGVRSNSSTSAGNDIERDLVRAPTHAVARDGAGIAPLPRPPPPPPSSWSPGLADFPPRRAAMHRWAGASRPMAATADFGPQHHGPFQLRREPPQGSLAMPWPTCKGPSRLSYGSTPVQHPGGGAFGGFDAIFGCNGAVSSVSTADDASGGVPAAAASLGGGATGGAGRGMTDAQAGLADAQAGMRSARVDGRRQ
ncbi:Putative NIN-like transcription factor [Ectocarpus siliculosus]|uniref:NIN-like transcription factor n=1 Tax=Ectocarpus siliculosus TaxID=2880 RepID=D7G8F1_ECTSI|nr:Putative NIN-like transcription factor [Ectocarpus siliculosus]|eukprot:CBJ27996.1 Putative NIN-like transcription factor [Ectocarpus siliculosus]